MATTTSAALVSQNTNDATFRLWISFIKDTFLLASCWVQTGDTGQINFATVTAPVAINTKQGYAIFRMNDTLQATSPVYVRIDFGSGAAALTTGIWITVGTGSDGVGNITTKRFDGGAVATPTVSPGSNNVNATTSYGSAGNNRIHCGLFIHTTAMSLTFSMERSKDSTGADTGDGLIMFYNEVVTNMNRQRYVVLTAAPQPTLEAGIQYVLSTNNPSSFGGEIGISLPIPMKGFGQPPGFGVAVVKSSDFGAGSTITVTVYSVSTTYQHLNSMQVTNAFASTDSAARVCIRFD